METHGNRGRGMKATMKNDLKYSLGRQLYELNIKYPRIGVVLLRINHNLYVKWHSIIAHYIWTLLFKETK